MNIYVDFDPKNMLIKDGVLQSAPIGGSLGVTSSVVGGSSTAPFKCLVKDTRDYLQYINSATDNAISICPRTTSDVEKASLNNALSKGYCIYTVARQAVYKPNIPDFQINSFSPVSRCLYSGASTKGAFSYVIAAFLYTNGTGFTGYNSFGNTASVQNNKVSLEGETFVLCNSERIAADDTRTLHELESSYVLSDIEYTSSRSVFTPANDFVSLVTLTLGSNCYSGFDFNSWYGRIYRFIITEWQPREDRQKFIKTLKQLYF